MNIGQTLEQALADQEPGRVRQPPVPPGKHFPGTSRAYALGVLLGLADWIQSQSLGRTPGRRVSQVFKKPPSRPVLTYSKVLQNSRIHLGNRKRVPQDGMLAVFHDAVVRFIQDGGSFRPQDKLGESGKIDYLVGLSAMNEYRRLHWAATNAGRMNQDPDVDPDSLPDGDVSEESAA